MSRTPDQPSIEDLARRYAAGESIRALAASINRSYGFVHRRLSEVMSLRPRGHQYGTSADPRRRHIHPRAQSRALTALGREYRPRYRELYREVQETRPHATASAQESMAKVALKREFPTRYRELYLAAVADERDRSAT